MSSLDPVWFAALSAGGVFVLMLIHELGHGVVYLVLGKTWSRMTIGFGMAVGSPEPRSYREQLVISAAGPILQAVAGAAVLTAAPAPWTLIWLIGTYGIAHGALNLVLPTGRYSDGYRFFRSAWAITRGRGRQII